MVMDRKTRRLEHRMVRDLPSILESGTLMVFNNSRVRRSRIYGASEAAGGKTEFLLLKRIDALSWQVLCKKSKRRRTGDRFVFDDVRGEIISVAASLKGEGEMILRFDRPVDDAWLDVHGHVPLPPYIKRADAEIDSERYQTVYAREHGSAAAPTAGLHFSGEILESLKGAGIETAYITLHVGLGTFLPVRSENLLDHVMHEEEFSIDGETACRIEKAKAEGRKILAVGTTSMRAIESAWTEDTSLPSLGRLRRGEGSTSIFIYPGFTFKVADALFTNFHTPCSTLLMLVSAFAGREFILESYREAVREGYRFFSYGDACLML
jgi:S-adenosylmethionine:tRNA ribosyltransferase-isomerase